MYAGMPAAKYPYGLAGVFDTIERVAGKVGQAAGKVERVSAQLTDVESGKKKVALVPSEGATFSIPVPGQSYAATIPMWPLLAGGAVLLFLALRRR